MSDRSKRRPAAVTTALALLTLAAMLPVAMVARADAPEGDPLPAASKTTATARRVRVVAAGRAEDLAALGSTLRELLGRIEVTLVLETASLEQAHAPSASRGDFAAVGVDLAPGGAMVVVADGTGREQMRRTLPPSSDRAASIEETAHVVQAAIEALTELREEGDAGPVPPAVAQVPPPVASEVPDAAVPPVMVAAVPTISAAPPPKDPPADLLEQHPPGHPHYGFDVVGALDSTIDGERSGVVIGGEAGMIVRRARDTSWLSPSLWVVADYHAPFRAIHDDVLVDISMVSARFLPTVALAKGDAWLLEGGAGAGFDVVIADPGTTQSTGVQVGPSRTDVDPILTAMVAAHTAIASSADLFIAARLDVDLGTERYQAISNGNTVTVFDPWTFRPELLVGFSLGLLGAPDYPAKKATP